MSSRGYSSFARVSLPRSDFTNCRVERLPSGTGVSDLTRGSLHGLEAFPAVYRAPSLFWHRTGYEFPEVRGRPVTRRCRHVRIPCVSVSLTVGLPLCLPREERITRIAPSLDGGSGGSGNSLVYHGLSAGPRVFLPSWGHPQTLDSTSCTGGRER